MIWRTATTMSDGEERVRVESVHVRGCERTSAALVRCRSFVIVIINVMIIIALAHIISVERRAKGEGSRVKGDGSVDQAKEQGGFKTPLVHCMQRAMFSVWRLIQ